MNIFQRKNLVCWSYLNGQLPAIALVTLIWMPLCWAILNHVRADTTGKLNEDCNVDITQHTEPCYDILKDR